MPDDTRGWFFVATLTTGLNGTTVREIRGGGRPAMVLAIGVVLAVLYLIYMIVGNPSRWESAGGAIIVLTVFVGLFIYFTERERRLNVSRQADEDLRTSRRSDMPLELIVWNVQHGSAAFVQTPNGKRMVIDLGTGDTFSPLNILLRAGIDQLDHVTITHPHMDHIDDILDFDKLSPKTLLVPKHLTEDDIVGGNPPADREARAKIQKYLEIRQRYNSPINPDDDVDLPKNNGGVSIKTFVPRQSPKSNLNNHSIVTAIEYAGVKILVPGDNEASSWEELLGRQDFVNAIKGTHVLVAAHHGRASGFHGALFEHFNPLITLVSDGRVVDTSITSRYTEVSRGWNVKKRNGGVEKRYCVTTRNDGRINVEVDRNSDPTRTGTLEVMID